MKARTSKKKQLRCRQTPRAAATVGCRRRAWVKARTSKKNSYDVNKRPRADAAPWRMARPTMQDTTKRNPQEKGRHTRGSEKHGDNNAEQIETIPPEKGLKPGVRRVAPLPRWQRGTNNAGQIKIIPPEKGLKPGVRRVAPQARQRRGQQCREPEKQLPGLRAFPGGSSLASWHLRTGFFCFVFFGPLTPGAAAARGQQRRMLQNQSPMSGRSHQGPGCPSLVKERSKFRGF